MIVLGRATTAIYASKRLRPGNPPRAYSLVDGFQRGLLANFTDLLQAVFAGLRGRYFSACVAPLGIRMASRNINAATGTEAVFVHAEIPA